MNLERFIHLSVSWCFSASIGSFQGLPAEASEVILLSQRLALKYNTTPRCACQHFLTSFFQILCGRVNPLSHRCAMPAPPRGELFETEVKFLVAFETLALRAMACALSVKAYGFDSSPKGRAKSTAENFLIMPNTLATSLRPWLSLRESWRGSA